jgi:hypothetical protein
MFFWLRRTWKMVDQDSRQFPPNRTPTPPNFRFLRSIVFVVRDEVFEMVLQRLGIGLLHALQDLDDDGREAVGVEVDFLVVGDLAEVAKRKEKKHVSSFGIFASVLIVWKGFFDAFFSSLLAVGRLDA